MPPNRPPVRAVLFDVDGTLVDTSYVHAVAGHRRCVNTVTWYRWRRSTEPSAWASTRSLTTSSAPTPRPIEVLFHSPVSCTGHHQFSDIRKTANVSP